MTYLNDGYFARGSVQFPLATSTGNTLLADADPVLSAVIDYLSAVITLHIGARWDQEVANPDLDMTSLVGKCVASTLAEDPLLYAQDETRQFPCLAVYRKREDFTNKTFSYDQAKSSFDAMWILPPLTSAQYHRFSPFLKAVSAIILDRLLLGYDSGYQSGAQVLLNAGVSQITIDNAQYGNLPDVKDEDIYLPTVVVSFSLTERRNPVAQYQPLEGVDTNTDLAGDPAITDNLDFKTELP